MPTIRISSSARSRAAFVFMPRWISSTSPIWRPTSMTGFSDDVGCWKIIEIRLPRIWRISSSDELEQVLAVEHDLAGLDPAGLARRAA